MKRKFQLLLKPYLIISLIFILLYNITCWVIYKKQGAIEIREDILNFWLPFALPWLPVLILLRPSIKLLKLKRKKRGDPVFAYMFVAVLTIAVPCFISENYVEKKTGEVTTLENIDQINNTSFTKYYSLKNYYVDKLHAGINYTSIVGGRYRSRLELHIYISCPIFTDEKQTFFRDKTVTKIGTINSNLTTTFQTSGSNTNNPLVILNDSIISIGQLYAISPQTVESMNVLKGNAAKELYGVNSVIVVTTKGKLNKKSYQSLAITPKAWLCINYYESISNYESNEKKKDDEHLFYIQSMNKFHDTDLVNFTYLDRIGNNDNRANYRKAAAKISNVSDSSLVIFEPKYNDYNSRTGSTLLWFFLSYIIGFVLWFTMIVIPKLNDEQFESALNSGTLNSC